MAIRIANTYASLWSVEKQEKYSKAQISTSEKDKNGEWTNSNWNANFVGSAHTKAAAQEKTKTPKRILITSGTVKTRTYEKDGQKRLAVDVTVFDFEYVTRESPAPKASESSSSTNSQHEEVISDSGEIPF